ncbi:conserved protein of unknown function [Pseudomonas marincola]|uniref:Uncharacterized protein n=1 Tax=Pseudomonas marincola TaxID=437900 RepID=A0A653E708_9PSED|nr:conserved protein of unknown function [Pseudomonas marincola]
MHIQDNVSIELPKILDPMVQPSMMLNVRTIITISTYI